MTHRSQVATAVLIGTKGATIPLASAERSRNIIVSHAGPRASTPGPETYFTGAVRVDDAFRGTEPSRISGATVRFEPGGERLGTAAHSARP